MKGNYKEYDNKTYVEYLDSALYILITTGDQKTIEEIKSKLSERNETIFGEIVSYKTLLILAKLARKKVYLEQSDDFEKLHILQEAREEADKLYEDYLASIEPPIFLEAIAHIAYYLAKQVLKKQADIHKKFLKSWEEWHVYLTKKNKNKRKGEQIKEKLRAILGDKIDDLEKIQQEHTIDIQRAKDGKGHMFIDIDNEIKTEDCTINERLILPPRLQASDILVIDEYTGCVEMDGKIYTLRDYYEMVKNDINQSWLYSTDLLKRIILTYLIKRCQNGDEQAFNKLYGFYYPHAERRALQFIRHKAQNYGKDVAFSEGGSLSEDEAKSAVGMILAVLLKGDDPANIYKYLDKDRSERKGFDFLNKRPHTALEESYNTLFQLINGQYTMLTRFQDELVQRNKDVLHRYKKAKKSATRKHYMQSLLQTSQYYLSRSNNSVMMFTMLDPLALLSISTQYNNNLFKPTKKGNLTSWLFGVKGSFPGKILEALNDWFKRNITTKNGKRTVPEDDYGLFTFEEDDFVDDFNKDELT